MLLCIYNFRWGIYIYAIDNGYLDNLFSLWIRLWGRKSRGDGQSLHTTSKAIVLLNAFNEDGTNPKVGFTLEFSDDNGNTSTKVIAPFASKLGDMFIAKCNSETHSNLKFDFPENIDMSSMTIKITYQTE